MEARALEELVDDAREMAFALPQESIEVECNFINSNLAELRAEKERVGTENQHLQNELSDLAFHNYRTYVDVGRTAEYCKEKFSEIGNNVHQLRIIFPNLIGNVSEFKEHSDETSNEFKMLDKIGLTNSQIWEFIKLPRLMEKSIRAGRYEQAYSMTNFAVNMKQTRLMQNPLFKNVIDYLLEARHSLLDELFSKFAGPLDLARSIQIVNNIRKIPYISNTQLRISILQYRDVYLEKKVHSIMTESDFILRVIEMYRESMYDTIVLYLAVFPDADVQRKFVSMNDDPRWERWTGSSQNYLLHSWAQKNIERLLNFIRGTEQKTLLDMEAMVFKLMSFAFSFGRMGLDFRPLVINEFSQMIVDIFRRKINLATKDLISTKLDIIDDEIFENTRTGLIDESERMDLAILSAPLELCIWDSLCVFGNKTIDALNEIRHSLSINFIRQIFGTLLSSLQNIFGWIDTFLSKPEEKSNATKAIFLLLRYFVPFINRCFFHCFPYDQYAKQYFRAEFCSVEEYNNIFTFANQNLFALCREDTLFNGISEKIEKDTRSLIFTQNGDRNTDDGGSVFTRTNDEHE